MYDTGIVCHGRRRISGTIRPPMASSSSPAIPIPMSFSLATSTPPFSTRFGRVLEAELQLCLRTLIACKRRQLDRLARHPQLFMHPRRAPVQCTPHAPFMRAIAIFEGALAQTTILFARDRLRKHAVQRASVGESTECCPSFFSPSSSTQAITVRRQSSSSTSAMTLLAKSPSRKNEQPPSKMHVDLGLYSKVPRNSGHKAFTIHR